VNLGNNGKTNRQMTGESCVCVCVCVCVRVVDGGCRMVYIHSLSQ